MIGKKLTVFPVGNLIAYLDRQKLARDAGAKSSAQPWPGSQARSAALKTLAELDHEYPSLRKLPPKVRRVIWGTQERPLVETRGKVRTYDIGGLAVARDLAKAAIASEVLFPADPGLLDDQPQSWALK